MIYILHLHLQKKLLQTTLTVVNRYDTNWIFPPFDISIMIIMHIRTVLLNWNNPKFNPIYAKKKKKKKKRWQYCNGLLSVGTYIQQQIQDLNKNLEDFLSATQKGQQG